MAARQAVKFGEEGGHFTVYEIRNLKQPEAVPEERFAIACQREGH
jgi:hypothetical protein